MFTRWGDLVYRFRFAVLGVMVAALAGLGVFGLPLGQHLSSSGWDDPGSESTQAAELLDATYGRDHTGDVIVLYTAPDGKTVDDPAFQKTVVNSLNNLPKNHPDQISQVYIAPWKVDNVANYSPTVTISKDRRVAFATIELEGNDDTTTMQNFREVKDAFDIPGVNVQVAGLQAVAGTLNDTIAQDQRRMEIFAIPAVGVLLFFIFGGVVAAALPLIVGGLTVIGASGIVIGHHEVHRGELLRLRGGVDDRPGPGDRLRTVHSEPLPRGAGRRVRDVARAVRRSVMTAGRTVASSATRSWWPRRGHSAVPPGLSANSSPTARCTVALAALASLTILPAMLSILGERVDMLGLRRFRKTRTTEEIENGFGAGWPDG